MTPLGLHYLLIHFDIPVVEAATWRLEVGGAVERPLALTLDELRARPARTLAVTLECAGNGRALMAAPRSPSQPWLMDAVGNAEWTGTPLAPLLEEARLAPSARELVFMGLDRGIQGGVEHAYARSLTVGEALRDDVLLAYAMNGEPLAPQHGFPLRLLVPGWYGMTHVKWLHSIAAVEEPFDGWQQVSAYTIHRGGAGRAGHAHAAALAPRPAGHPRVPLPRALRRGRALRAHGARLVGVGARRARRGEHRRGHELAPLGSG